MTRCILQDGIHLGQLMVDGSNQTCRGDLEATFHFFVICIQEIAIRAPRIISNLQDRCGHEKAAEVAAEREKLNSTIDKIA